MGLNAENGAVVLHGKKTIINVAFDQIDRVISCLVSINNAKNLKKARILQQISAIG